MDYPYMVSNNKIGAILEKIETASKPSKFTNEFLKKLGFTSSNDRAIIPLLKRLGFLNADGVPTECYDRLKDETQHAHVLGERIRDLYSELYTINTDIHKSADQEIKGAISRVTGKDQASVSRYFNTFKALVSLAKFNLIPEKKDKPRKDMATVEKIEANPENSKTQFHYNIQIHLPATTDVSVYNAIFKSLKDNLII